MVAVELEVMSKKHDRFGWDRDRGSASHDRLVTDWMDALQDYPLAEVQEACRRWVRDNPSKMPNEGHILGVIKKRRRDYVQSLPKTRQEEPPRANRPTAERANQIIREVLGR